MVSGLTDEWGELEIELKNVRAFAAKELNAEENQLVDKLIRDIHEIVHR